MQQMSGRRLTLRYPYRYNAFAYLRSQQKAYLRQNAQGAYPASWQPIAGGDGNRTEDSCRQACSLPRTLRKEGAESCRQTQVLWHSRPGFAEDIRIGDPYRQGCRHGICLLTGIFHFQKLRNRYSTCPQFGDIRLHGILADA